MSSYPVSTEATARVIEVDLEEEQEAAARIAQEPVTQPAEEAPGQAALFDQTNVPAASSGRVIAFESLTTRAELRSIRARAAGLERPAPVRTERVEVKRPRRKARSSGQTSLEFSFREEAPALPQSNIICDAPVAPISLRAQAAFVDLFWMLAPCVAGVALFRYVGGEIVLDKHVLPFLAIALATVPFFYRFLWTIAGRDSLGMQAAGLVLVDFDGNPPSRGHRYQRLFGGFLSFLAAGIGLIWPVVDEDRLTWHDHVSSTFPTLRDS